MRVVVLETKRYTLEIPAEVEAGGQEEIDNFVCESEPTNADAEVYWHIDLSA